MCLKWSLGKQIRFPKTIRVWVWYSVIRWKKVTAKSSTGEVILKAAIVSLKMEPAQIQDRTDNGSWPTGGRAEPSVWNCLPPLTAVLSYSYVYS
jgi:hypothetical protein